MVRSGNKPSDTERELQAYTDELGIRHHAERLEANLGPDRAVEIIERVARSIAARRQSLPLAAVGPVRI